MLSLFEERKRLINNFVRNIAGTGAPTDGTTGAGDCGPGSLYFDYTNAKIYMNNGTKSSPVWTVLAGNNAFQQFVGTISSANITGTSAGQFGHAQGFVLVPAQGTHFVVELESVVMNYDFVTAAYTGGGNVSVNFGAGGAALTGVVSAANGVGAAADKSVLFVPLSTAGIALVENASINLVAAAAFTQPGTAAGVIRYVANVRVHATGF